MTTLLIGIFGSDAFLSYVSKAGLKFDLLVRSTVRLDFRI